MKVQATITLLLYFLSFEIEAQSFAVDSTFQPFFDVYQTFRTGSVSIVWEDTNNGKLWISGNFRFTAGGKQHDGFTSLNRDGSRNLSYKNLIGRSENFFGINDSINMAASGHSFAQVDSNGIVTNNWNTNHRKTAQCISTSQPYVYEDGSILVSNSNGNNGGCDIINSPDTFPHRYIVKIDPQGKWDSTFKKDASGILGGFAPYDSNRIWAFGRKWNFIFYDSILVNGLCRIYTDGRLDTTFKNPLWNGDPWRDNSYAFSKTEDDGGFFLMGNFYLKDDTTKIKTLVRLNENGSLDTNFQNGGPLDSNSMYGGVNTICPTPDGGYLVGGTFNKYQGYVKNCIAKIDSNGKVEPQYFTSLGPDSAHRVGWDVGVHKILRSNFGGYYVAGEFLKWDGKKSQPIIRLKDLVVGIEESQSQEFFPLTVFPNPTKEYVQIHLKTRNSIKEIRLFDLMGKQYPVTYVKSSGWEYSVNLVDRQHGVYVLKVILDNGSALSKKVIKR